MINLRFPSINGKTEQERLQQMQSYMYQLVEQLQFALDAINSQLKKEPITTSETLRIIPSVPADMIGSDFIVEAETKDGWTYKKWKSGTFEMFGTFTVTATTIGTPSGSMYYSEQFTIPSPFACSLAVVSGMAINDWYIPIAGGLADGDNNNIGFKLFKPYGRFAVGQEISIGLHVTGIYI